MKKLIIVSILWFAAIDVYAQQTEQPAAKSGVNCKRAPNMPANAVPAFPKSAYTPTGDPSCPPCYTYKTKKGLEVMECPYLWFPPEHSTNSADVPDNTVQTNTTGNMDVQAQRTYTGNYPSCKRAPNIPANAKMVFPKAAYTPTGDPTCPPCYEYTTKRGLKVMECPYLWFPAEHSEQ